MKDRKIISNPIIISSILGFFIFYIYFKPYWFLGIIFGIVFGVLFHNLLTTWKIKYVRTRFLTITTILTWVGSISLLIMMNLPSFMRYFAMHLSTYEPAFLTVGYAHVPFVRQLPYTLGSTILAQLSLPWVEITIPFPVERLLFLIVPFHYPPITIGMFLFVLIPYLIIVLTFGRGFCGWVCYFGNQTECIALKGKINWRMTILRQSFRTKNGRMVLDSLKESVKNIKYYVMIILLLPTFIIGMNTICTLNLIFKFAYPIVAILIVFILILLGAILPLKTGKRWWCLLCPAGAGIALVDTITPFKISIDHSKCDHCYDCSNVCPMHAISPSILEKDDKPNLDCVKCLRCTEACSKGAIDIFIRGTDRRVRGFFSSFIMIIATSWYVWFAVSIVELFYILV